MLLELKNGIFVLEITSIISMGPPPRMLADQIYAYENGKGKGMSESEYKSILREFINWAGFSEDRPVEPTSDTGIMSSLKEKYAAEIATEKRYHDYILYQKSQEREQRMLETPICECIIL